MKLVSTTGASVVLTKRGHPVAVLICMAEFQSLRQVHYKPDVEKWLAETASFSEKIARRRGAPVDIDAILDASRTDLDNRIS
jgi:prevent-host-death family protein